jgi:SNF2-related domain/Helicase conserved C-terminal domain
MKWGWESKATLFLTMFVSCQDRSLTLYFYLYRTVQGIASMAVYHEDWPLLVLTPSSARYHWENEFQQWLGRDSRVNNEEQSRVNLGGESDGEEEDENEIVDESNCMPLLDDSQIHVLTSGKDDILPRTNTMVVICSYGLAPTLAASGKMYPGLFRAAIVDESHMLKNMNTKRTKQLVPVLSATNRCVLLSGTPALAKPSELWPQLKVLNTANSGWWEEEDSFYDKYVKNSSAIRRAELHAMLTGTVMIRRLKHDILKSLPRKSRGRAIVDICTPEMKSEFYRCMAILREGKGQLGKLAKEHSALGPAGGAPAGPSQASLEFERAKAAIKAEQDAKYAERIRQIDYALVSSGSTLDEADREQWRRQAVESLQREVQVWYQERLHELQEEIPEREEEELSKKSVLNRMYSLTGKAKIPLVSSMIKKWLSDPTKGKLCVFAHHIFVLDELVRLSELSNHAGSKAMYIRIDGSTSPKERQAQIKKFQSDPNFRIAILGITAAGVAVTLTASSTVWFTELFWTPALMIQAEDRCHRIGQNSRVHCLYFVASGTLDDLLWRLLEKKFRDLGEFVEGMEKQKIVVHKTYHGTNELDAMFGLSPPEDEEDVELNFDAESHEDEGGKDILKLENDLQEDIEILGREELTMIKVDGDDDEDVVEESALDRAKSEFLPGSTEHEAILLSDDEDDSKKEGNALQEDSKLKQAVGEADPSATVGAKNIDKVNVPVPKAPEGFDIRRPLARCSAYSVMFEGESYGMKLFTFHGRVVVGKNLNQHYDRPSQYALVVGVNGQALPMLNDLGQIMRYMKASLERGPVELLFVEVPDLVEECKRMEAEKVRLRKEHNEAANKGLAASTSTADVIELLDDD